MASLTSKTRTIRGRKKSRAGLERKRQIRAKGSTPKFAVHTEESKKAKA